MVKVEMNSKSENPFYGLRNCLKLFQASTTIITEPLLNAAYAEVKDNIEKRQLFYSILFSIGDVTGRQHNIFKGQKKDSGGNAARDSFYIIMQWLKKTDYAQFKAFMNAHLFNEFTCFDNLFKNRVKTQKQQVVSVYHNYTDEKYCEDLADFLVSIIKGTNEFDKFLVGKFLTIPRTSKRAHSKKMLPETLQVMKEKVNFLILLSDKMKWQYVRKSGYVDFVGYKNWRKQYNMELESVLFSTGNIRQMDEIQFLKWLEILPAQARFRVRNRVYFSKDKDENLKYPQLKLWFEKWEKYKEEKQGEQRVLEEKMRQGTATIEDEVQLKKVKKEAKVTVGSTNFKELYDQIRFGQIDTLKLEAFMNRINLPYNSLVILDDSGSMRGAPFSFATFMASVCLYKNPDDDGRNLIGMFNNRSKLYSYVDSQQSRTPNALMRGATTNIIHTPFVNPHESFLQNAKRITQFCMSKFSGGGTDISSIPKGFKIACDENPQVLDYLKNYPIWTIISDGEWNQMHSPEASMNDFFRNCENLLGFKPYIIAIDIPEGTSAHLKADRFSGIDNMIYIPGNPAQIEQFLTNFKDMDTFDVYTPLQSIFRSNRYESVRQHTL